MEKGRPESDLSAVHSRTHLDWPPSVTSRLTLPGSASRKGPPSRQSQDTSRYWKSGFGGVQPAYRWHSCIGELDEKWTQNVYHELFGKEAADVSMVELMIGLKKYDEHMPKDPMQRPFAHLKRGEDGKFADDDLVKIMQTGVEEVAGMLGIPKHSSFSILVPNQQLTKEYASCFC